MPTSESQTSERPTIALTMGDPAGIGPEVVLKAVADPEVAPLARWIIVGDGGVLELAQRITSTPIQAELRDPQALQNPADFAFGRLDARSAHEGDYDTPLSAEDRAWLVERYAPDVRDLEKLLGWDLAAWRT